MDDEFVSAEVKSLQLRVEELELENARLMASEEDTFQSYVEALKANEVDDEAELHQQATERDLAQQQRAFERRLERVRAEGVEKARKIRLEAEVKIAKLEARLAEQDRALEATNQLNRDIELQNRLLQLPKAPQSGSRPSKHQMQLLIEELQTKVHALELNADIEEDEDEEMDEPKSKKRKRKAKKKDVVQKTTDPLQ